MNLSERLARSAAGLAGESLTFPAIIVNRFHMDALILQDGYVSMGR